VAFSPDGKWLAAIVHSPLIERHHPHIWLWDVKTRKLVTRLRLRGSVDAWILAFTPDGKSLVSSCNGRADGTEKPTIAIEVWDLVKKPARLIIEPPAECGQAGAIGPDSRTLVLAGDKVRVYDLKSGQLKATLEHKEKVDLVVLSRDGKWLAMTHPNGGLSLWDFKKRKRLWMVDAHGPRTTPKVAISADGERVASADGSDLKVWNRATGKLLHQIDTYKYSSSNASPLPSTGGSLSSGSRNFKRRPLVASSITFIKDTRSVVVTGLSAASGIYVWDPERDQLRGEQQQRKSPFKAAWHAALSPDGTLLAGVYNEVYLWDIRSLWSKK
jgi:WD40 repeat protein